MIKLYQQNKKLNFNNYSQQQTQKEIIMVTGHLGCGEAELAISK